MRKQRKSYQKINSMLKELSRINKEWGKTDLSRIQTDSTDTIFERSGLLDKNGNPLTYKQIVSKYGVRATYKFEQLEKMIDPRFTYRLNRQYKLNLIDQMEKMGYSKEDIKRLKKMSINRFVKWYNDGRFDEIIYKYEALKEAQIKETFGDMVEESEYIGQDPSELL